MEILFCEIVKAYKNEMQFPIFLPQLCNNTSQSQAPSAEIPRALHSPGQIILAKLQLRRRVVFIKKLLNR